MSTATLTVPESTAQLAVYYPACELLLERIALTFGIKSWAAHETGGASEATWADFETGGASPTTWADLET